MPLQERLIPFPFSNGLNTKLDPKSPKLAGQLLRCDNGVFTRPDRLQLRNGFRALSTSIEGGGVITDGRALTPYGDELVLADSTSLYSYNPSADNWVRKGALSSLVVTARPVCRNTNVAHAADGSIHSSGVGVYAWQDTDGLVRYSIVSSTTGTIVSNASLGAGQLPKAIVVGDFFAVYFVSAGTPVLKLALVPVASPRLAPTVTDLTSSVTPEQELSAALPAYDVCLWPSPAAATSVYVAFNNATASTGGTSLAFFDPGQPEQQLVLTSWTIPASVLGVFPDANGPVVLSYSDTDHHVRFRAWQDFHVGALDAPVISGLTPGSGGSLAPGTYGYRVSAVDGSGHESVAGPEVTTTIGGAVTTITVAWPAVPGASFYNVYGRTPLFEELLGTTASLFAIDDGMTTATLPLAPNLPTPVELGAAVIAFQTNCIALGGVAVDGTPTWEVLWTQLGIDAPESSATWAATVTSYTAAAATVAQPNLILVGKPYLYLGAAWALFLHQSKLQATYFVGDTEGNLAAKFLYSTAGNSLIASTIAYPVPLLSEVTQLTASSFGQSLVQALSLTTVEGTVQGIYGVTAYTWDYADPQDGYSRAELAQTLLWGGGFVAQYDGDTVGELGFHLGPDPDHLGVNAISGPGQLSAGTYAYLVTYEWTDNQGHLQRSVPVAPREVTVTAGQGVQLTLPYLGITAHAGVVLQVYRTVADVPGVYYLANTTTQPGDAPQTNAPTNNVRVTLPDPTHPTCLWYDLNLSDLDLVGNPPLYTNGNAAPNVMPNAVSALTVWDNRVFAVDAPNPLLCWMTRQALPNTPPEFSSRLQYNVDPRGGGVTALGFLDQSLVLYKRSMIFTTGGQGPDNTGEGSYPDAAFCSAAVGCANHRSIGTVPAGQVFSSVQGIHLLDHALQVSYQGAAVEQYNDQVVTSCQLVPTTKEIRWTLQPTEETPDGTMLMLDYFVNQWATFTPCAGVDAAVWEDTYLFLQPDGTVRQELPGVYTDAGEFISLDLESSNLQLGGQQAWQQVWEVYILGMAESPHNLQVAVATDFSPGYDQVEVVTPEPAGTWGSDSTWGGLLPGDSKTWGGTWNPYRWRVFVANTECQAIRIRVTTYQQPGEEPGQGCSLSGLALLYGVFGKAAPVKASQTF